ncbi:AraC-type DNA-binding protein [Treponema bryantii]|uniref:AraC-type DNA-binding protein n=1 Tax=Treponema bryantii TaxID=163 RepID=A0A1H9HBQ1_9SPIR|nr:AraC family transcriptional regulator [Treponema bryantii]SEQ59713.1 AraC-type DNA-binding protein [Treponema bryantii]
MMNEISYRKKNDDIECVHYKNWTKTYPPHTHAEHLTLGIVEAGKVCIVMNGASKVFCEGDEFQIPPDVLHEIKPVDDKGYSMLVTCVRVPAQAQTDPDDKSDAPLIELKDSILDQPENLYLIEEMAQDTNISPFHLIRKFKKLYGLTPHQFQIQCKVRKAQKLLEEEKSVCEVTYDAGFCDQSHLDRCFQKIVGMTPKEYKEASSPSENTSTKPGKTSQKDKDLPDRH